MASSSDPAPLLPGSLRARLEAWLCRMLGYALLAACLAAAASLLTWSAADPSLMRTANGAVRNALGPAGANFSGLAMRLFGLAAVFIILPPAFWALQMITRHELEDARVKLMLAPVAALLMACAASALPAPAAWPLPHGLGGLLGDLVLKSLAGLFVAMGPERAATVTGAGCLLAGLMLLTGSLGMSLQDLRLICRVQWPSLQPITRGWRWLAGSTPRSEDTFYARREPTFAMPPRASGAPGVREVVHHSALSLDPAFEYELRTAPAGAAPPGAANRRIALRRPVQDPEFDRTTEAGSRAMAERFAPAHDDPAHDEPAGQAGGFRFTPRRGISWQGAREAAPPRAHASGSANPAVRRPVWAGSVPAPADEEAPPSGEPLVSHVSGVGDELYGRALAIVRADGKASAERLQQRLRIGFLRAASLIDRMEQDGILGPPVHNGMRPILGGSSPPRPRTV